MQLDQPVVDLERNQTAPLFLKVDALPQDLKHLLFAAQKASQHTVARDCARKAPASSTTGRQYSMPSSSCCCTSSRRTRFHMIRLPGPHEVGKNAVRKQHGLAAVNQPQEPQTQRPRCRSHVATFVENNVNRLTVPSALARRGVHVRGHVHQPIAKRIASRQALHTPASSMVTSALMSMCSISLAHMSGLTCAKIKATNRS